MPLRSLVCCGNSIGICRNPAAVRVGTGGWNSPEIVFLFRPAADPSSRPFQGRIHGVSNSPVRAITFDLWDTIVHDDSDEPKRAARGLRTKRAERRHLVWEALNRVEPIDQTAVDLACDTAEAAFNRVWRSQHVTWTIAERLDVTLKGLKRSLPDEAFEELVRAHEVMEVDIEPDLIEGCRDALEELASRFRLAIVSDAIVTPGRKLRDLLKKHDVLRYFDGFAFSDEVGRSKPHASMFRSAAEQLGVDVEQMIHIGDRDHNDVRGAHAVGMRAVLFTATRDVDRHTTRADAICSRYADLPGIIDTLVSAGH